MTDNQQVKDDYEAQASSYNDYLSTPLGTLETQLLLSAFGDCTDQTVLDLGGGTAARARDVLDAGASRVDVVDISPEMMEVGRKIEASLGRDKIRWYEADISRPLDHLSLGKYDLVMANWVFDHAGSVEALEGMWRNVSVHLKPGGRFVGVRSGNPRSPAFLSGKYGSKYTNLKEIPGGLKFRVTLAATPPIEFEATCMEISWSGSTELHQKFGLENVKHEAVEDKEMYKKDSQFWSLFLEDPPMVVVTGTKKA
jgi:SAM-dependent methyltransferase